MNQDILVVVDYQNDFVAGAFGFRSARLIEDRLYKKVVEYLNGGKRVFFTVDAPDESADEERPSRYPAHCAYGTEGGHLYGRLREFEESDYQKSVCFVKKETYLTTGLAKAIQRYNMAPDGIELCGISTNVCVIANAFYIQSAFFNSRIVVDGSCCASKEKALHDKALAVMASAGMRVV